MSEARPTTSPRYGRVPLAVADSGALAAMSHRALRVYVALCLHGDAEWNARPSIDTLASRTRTGMGRRRVQAGVTELVRLGVITADRSGGVQSNGKGKATRYTLSTNAEAMHQRALMVSTLQGEKAKARALRFVKSKGAHGEHQRALMVSAKGCSPRAPEQLSEQLSEQREKKPATVIPAQAQKAVPPATPAPAQVSSVESQAVEALDRHLQNLRKWRVKSDRATPLAASLPALMKGIA